MLKSQVGTSLIGVLFSRLYKSEMRFRLTSAW